MPENVYPEGKSHASNKQGVVVRERGPRYRDGLKKKKEVNTFFVVQNSAAANC